MYLQSRGAKPLRRYFPELEFPRGRYVLDGELLILGADGHEQFDALQNRLHPAESQVRMLAAETPSLLRAFDLLVEGKEKLLNHAFSERRERLESLVAGLGGRRKAAAGSIELTPLERRLAKTAGWLQGGEGRDRQAARCAVPPRRAQGDGQGEACPDRRLRGRGLASQKEEGTVGSLILGLYDDGELRVVGHTSGFKAKEKRELVAKLAPYETGERGSGDPSRWDSGRDLEWIELRPELVVEVTFDHVSDGRIRHGTKVLRWREDKAPEECAFTQLQ